MRALVFGQHVYVILRLIHISYFVYSKLFETDRTDTHFEICVGR